MVEEYQIDDYDCDRRYLLAISVHWYGVWTTCMGEVCWTLAHSRVASRIFQRACFFFKYPVSGVASGFDFLMRPRCDGHLLFCFSEFAPFLLLGLFSYSSLYITAI